jgi:hypothetical protein
VAEELTGRWRDTRGGDVVEIVGQPGKRYELQWCERGTREVKRELVEVVPIGTRYYLFSVGGEIPAPEGGTVLFPVCRAKLDHGGMTLDALSPVALRGWLEQHPDALMWRLADPPSPTTVPASSRTVRYPNLHAQLAEIERPLILTDSPERIRQFLVEHEDEATLFKRIVELKKD